MSKSLESLNGELETLRSEIATLDAIESPTEDDATRLSVAIDQFDSLKADAARASKIADIKSASFESTNVESGFSAPNVIIKRSAFENLDAVRSGMISDEDLVARALNGIEDSKASDEAREQATLRAENSPAVARQALLTGSPEYRAAFTKALRNPDGFNAELSPEEASAFRTALSTTGANGGYAIPFLLDPTVILTNAGSANPFRQISRVVQGTSNKWNGLTSAGVTAEWKTEGSAAADASPTVGQPSITAYLADAYVLGSYEVLEDTNLASDLPALIADAKDRLEAAAFATGTGSGQPFGIVTSTTAITTSRIAPTTGGTFGTASVADVYNVISGVPARNRSNASWVANYATLNTIRQMSPAAAGSSFWATLDASLPSTLLGRPVYEASSVVSTVTTGSNILLAGDFSQFVIYDRIGMSLEYVPQVFDTATGRPTGQRGWIAHWRVGSDVTNAGAFRVLKL